MKAWHELKIAEKRTVIEKVYEEGGSASTIAARISCETGFKVSRNAVIGFYMRHPELHNTHPFTGRRAGAALKKTVRELPNGPIRRAPVTTKRKFGFLDQIGEGEPEKPVSEAVAKATEYERFDSNGLRIPLMELGKFHCRYALTENVPHLFCGHEVKEGSSYCHHHHARITRPAPEIIKRQRKSKYA